jgi:hypothetical protein
LNGVLAPGAIDQLYPFTIEGFSDATPGDLCHEDLSFVKQGDFTDIQNLWEVLSHSYTLKAEGELSEGIRHSWTYEGT